MNNPLKRDKKEEAKDKQKLNIIIAGCGKSPVVFIKVNRSIITVIFIGMDLELITGTCSKSY